MSIQIYLDQSRTKFTNHDVISGRVCVTVRDATSTTAITIKLEGESRTRLENGVDRRNRHEVELHRFLYKVFVLFPPSELQSNDGTFTLAAGNYTYPFSFTIPEMTECAAEKNMSGTVRFTSWYPEFVRPAPSHSPAAPLPPTMQIFNGDGAVKYFLKATLDRPEIYKENLRAIFPFEFSPMPTNQTFPTEQGRDVCLSCRGTADDNFFDNNNDQNAASSSQAGGRPSLPSRLGFISRKPVTSPKLDSSGKGVMDLQLRIYAQLSGCLVVNKPIPLQINISMMNRPTTEAILALTSIHIELIGKTQIVAQGINSERSNSTVMFSKSYLNHRLDFNPETKHAYIPSEFWSRIAIPDILTPSFQICNIIHQYELQIRFDLRWDVKGVPEPPRRTIDFLLNTCLFTDMTQTSQPSANTAKPGGPTQSSSTMPGPVFPPMSSGSSSSAFASASAAASTNPKTSQVQQPPPLPARPRPGTSSATTAASTIPIVSNPNVVSGGTISHNDELYEDPPPTYAEAIADGAGTVTDHNETNPHTNNTR